MTMTLLIVLGGAQNKIEGKFKNIHIAIAGLGSLEDFWKPNLQ